MRKAEITFGVAAILFAALFFILAGAFPEPKSRDVGMAFYPRILSGLIVLLSLSVIYQAIRKKRPESSGQEPMFDTEEGGLKRVFLMIGLTVVYQQVIGFAGFLVVTPIYLIILMLVFHAASLWRIVLISGSTTLVIYLAFQRMLKIPLPTGIFYN